MKNGMRAIHPGETLREEYLKPIGITPHALSRALKLPPARVNEIVREKRGVTPETAMRLARFFGGDAQSWTNLQVAYDLKIAEKAAAKKIEKEIIPSEAELGIDDVELEDDMEYDFPEEDIDDSDYAESLEDLGANYPDKEY